MQPPEPADEARDGADAPYIMPPPPTPASIDDPARWMAAYRTKATHRVVSAVAFAVDLSVDEAKIRGQGNAKSMPNLYRKIFRRARRTAVVN